MIKELKQVLEKYKRIKKTSEYVSVAEVVNDVYALIQDQRIKRLPQKER